MKKSINKLWSKISEIGIYAEMDEGEKRRIQILNRTIFLVIDASIFFLLLDLITGAYALIPVILFSFTICVSVLFLIHKRKHLLAKFISIIFFIIYIAICSIITGKNSGTDIIMIPVILLPTIIFKEKIIIFIFSFISVGTLGFLNWFNYKYGLNIIGFSDEILAFYMFSGALTAMVISFFIIWYFRNINQEYEDIILKKNKKLINSNEQIKLQKINIEEKSKEVTDSINYASRIQHAILPQKQKIDNFLPDNFIIYKPKDIVAGDFYWIEKVDNNLIIAAADCTGHGVPGAMVSVVCHNALNRAVREFNHIEPDKILNKTRELVIETFDQGDEDVKDGMDIALCTINLNTKQLQFAGANNPLFIIKNNKLHITKGDRQPIGDFMKSKPFTINKIDLAKGDTIYIFTDGYADQFGGPNGKKLKQKKMKELLLSNINLSMKEQKLIIEDAFETWKGKIEQIDDVCIVGFRI